MTFEIKGINCVTKEEAEHIKNAMVDAYKALGSKSLSGDDFALTMYYANKQINWMHAPIKELEQEAT